MFIIMIMKLVFIWCNETTHHVSVGLVKYLGHSDDNVNYTFDNNDKEDDIDLDDESDDVYLMTLYGYLCVNLVDYHDSEYDDDNDIDADDDNDVDADDIDADDANDVDADNDDEFSNGQENHESYCKW